MKIRQALLIAALAVITVAQAKPHESKKSHSVKHSREHELTNRMGHGDHHRRDHGSASSSLSSTHKDGSATQKPTHDKVYTIDTIHIIPELKKDLHLHHITEHNIEKKKDDDKTPGKTFLETNRVPEFATGTHKFGEAMVASAIQVPKQIKEPMAVKDTAPPPSPPHVVSNRTPLVPQMQPKAIDKLNLRNTTVTKTGENYTKDTGVLMESEHLIHVTARPAKTHRTKGNHHKNKSNNQTTTTPANKGSSSSTRKIQKTPKKYSAKKHGWKKTPRKEKTAKERLREKYERREKRAKALHHAIAGKKN
ncbi:unnamed protein product [Meganyctiphanes norvegica]|uniref:Uncharacterized protein n=1 Tax=Meganyctiphanes norvegica TaxID=48144 RepID=A0AAV2RBV7_MEGNR